MAGVSEVLLPGDASTSSNPVPYEEHTDGIVQYIHEMNVSLRKIDERLRKMSARKKKVDATAVGTHSVIARFFDGIEMLDTENLLSVIQRQPWLLVKMGSQGPTALHAAVIAKSQELVGKLLQLAFKDGNMDPIALQLVCAVDKELLLKAIDFAYIIGEKDIVGTLEDAVRRLKGKYHCAINCTHGGPAESVEEDIQQIQHIRDKLHRERNHVLDDLWGERRQCEIYWILEVPI